MRAFLLFIILLAGIHASAQDLSGIWRGHFENDISNRMMQLPGMEDRYKFEVQLDQNEKAFKGVTYSYRTTVFYGKASCYGAINTKTKKVFLEEMKILEMKSSGGGACIMTCFLQYSKVGDEEVLEGNYTSMSTTDSTQCGKGTVYLRKVETSDFYKEPFLVNKEKAKPRPVKPAPLARAGEQPKQNITKPPAKNKPPETTAKPPAKSNQRAATDRPRATPPRPATESKPPVKTPARPKTSIPEVVVPNENAESLPEDSVKKMTGKSSNLAQPQVLATRQNELVKTIVTAANDITIKIYDNGTIDNDTVTVYVDNKLVVSKARLTEKAIVVRLALDDNTAEHELVMVADNLGEIPPNTSLMVVNAGDQQYEVRITSTEQKNAVVRFKYLPKK